MIAQELKTISPGLQANRFRSGFLAQQPNKNSTNWSNSQLYMVKVCQGGE